MLEIQSSSLTFDDSCLFAEVAKLIGELSCSAKLNSINNQMHDAREEYADAVSGSRSVKVSSETIARFGARLDKSVGNRHCNAPKGSAG